MKDLVKKNEAIESLKNGMMIAIGKINKMHPEKMTELLTNASSALGSNVSEDMIKNIFEQISEEQSEKLVNVIAAGYSEMITLATDTIKGEIKDVAEMYYGKDETVGLTKYALFQVGLPFELHSTKDGQDFIEADRNSEFKGYRGRRKLKVMSDKEIEMSNILKKHKDKNKGQGSNKGPMSDFATNLIHNSIPEQYAASQANVKAKEESARKAQEREDEYKALVEDGVEDILYKYWDSNKIKFQKDDAEKTNLKTAKNAYEGMTSYIGKLKFLRLFKQLFEAELKKFIARGTESRMLKDQENKFKSGIGYKLFLEEYEKLSDARKWLKVKIYAVLKYEIMSNDFIDNVDYHNKQKADKLNREKANRTNKKKTENQIEKMRLKKEKEAKATQDFLLI